MFNGISSRNAESCLQTLLFSTDYISKFFIHSYAFSRYKHVAGPEAATEPWCFFCICIVNNNQFRFFSKRGDFWTGAVKPWTINYQAHHHPEFYHYTRSLIREWFGILNRAVFHTYPGSCNRHWPSGGHGNAGSGSGIKHVPLFRRRTAAWRVHWLSSRYKIPGSRVRNKIHGVKQVKRCYDCQLVFWLKLPFKGKNKLIGAAYYFYTASLPERVIRFLAGIPG